MNPSSDSSLIQIRGVSKDYDTGGGTVHALRELSLDISHGEFVAIVGTSGSGKSTLMNILGCLDRPTHGTYSLAGFDVGARTNDGRALVRNRLIGFIFQGFNLLPRTSALENCELPLQYRGVPAAKRREQAMQALASVGLADRVHHTPNQLSGGQQQRVAIARALVTEPPLLLADEPTGNLDTRTSLEVLALLQTLNRDRGITIVLVTHEHDIAACASRVMTFRDGRMVSDERHEPVNAAAQLAALPPPEAKGKAEAEDEAHDLGGRSLGAPIPVMLFVSMFFTGAFGAFVGALYNALVLDAHVLWIPILSAALFQVAGGATFARKHFGRALTTDQRARAALYYTLIEFALVAAVLAVWMPARFLERVVHYSQTSALLPFGLLLLIAVAMTLFRFLTFALFGKRVVRGHA